MGFGLGGIFDIRELAFDVALSTAAATGHFRVSVLVSIGQHLQLSLDINLNNMLSFVKKIEEHADYP